MMHTVESLEKQLAQIDQMLDECKKKKNLDRLIDHLKGRRETTIRELERARKKENDKCADVCGFYGCDG